MEGKVGFYVRPRGNCVAVIAGPGLKGGGGWPGGGVQKRKKTVQRLLFFCHCL